MKLRFGKKQKQKELLNQKKIKIN